MLPNRLNEVISILAAVGLTIGVATITTASITTATIVSSSTTNATSTNLEATGQASTTKLAINGGSFITKFQAASAVIDVNSIGNGSNTSSAVAVTGAAVGNTALVGLTGDWTGASSSVRVLGSVTAAGTVTLVFQNGSSTAVNLTNSTYNVDVIAP